MRIEEINKWIDEGESLPQDLTQEEREHLVKLGWMTGVSSLEDFDGMRSFSVFDYLHGKIHGKYKGWWDNGQKKWKCHFLHGGLHGKYEAWWENGQKKCEFGWLHGKEHGKAMAWHPNGQKWFVHHRLHGKFHGKRECWDEDGSLTKDHEYFYGNRIK